MEYDGCVYESCQIRFAYLYPFLDILARNIYYRCVLYTKIVYVYKTDIRISIWTINQLELAVYYIRSVCIYNANLFPSKVSDVKLTQTIHHLIRLSRYILLYTQREIRATISLYGFKNPSAPRTNREDRSRCRAYGLVRDRPAKGKLPHQVYSIDEIERIRATKVGHLLCSSRGWCFIWRATAKKVTATHIYLYIHAMRLSLFDIAPASNIVRGDVSVFVVYIHLMLLYTPGVSYRCVLSLLQRTSGYRLLIECVSFVK